MQENFKINVTKPVNKVKSTDLLFYPVIMHIFAQGLRVSGFRFDYSAYLNTLNEDNKDVLYQALEADFNAYFDTYVRNCFCNRPAGVLPQNTVLFFPANSGTVDEKYKNIPTFFIYDIEEINDEYFIKFATSNIHLNADFANLCEELSELF
ncbi:MAG: hypothetical protein E7016_05370 [Alphaproteobacteria bacterium]|nr:hypothetical protein [Alphaproteobacteria bacterium]